MNTRRGIVIICGPMRSQKTADFLLHIQIEVERQGTGILIKPTTDKRDEDIKSRAGFSMPCIRIAPGDEEKILEITHDCDFVAFEEAQFFSIKLLTVIRKLYHAGKYVLVSLLDTDFFGKYFAIVPSLLAIPEALIIKKRAVCEKCRTHNATRTDLIDKELRKQFARGENPELVGDDPYQVLCYECFYRVNPEDSPE